MHAASAPAPGDPGRAFYRFGDVVVDTHARTVSRAGIPRPVEPKAYLVLLALLARPHELVTHEELLDGVWGHRHVTAGVVTRAIAQVRRALGDDAHAPRYIRTRHSLGYCFIGDILPEDAAESPADTHSPDAAPTPAGASPMPGTQGTPADPAPPERRGRRRRRGDTLGPDQAEGQEHERPPDPLRKNRGGLYAGTWAVAFGTIVGLLALPKACGPGAAAAAADPAADPGSGIDISRSPPATKGTAPARRRVAGPHMPRAGPVPERPDPGAAAKTPTARGRPR